MAINYIFVLKFKLKKTKRVKESRIIKTRWRYFSDGKWRNIY